ncbi:hypothetical protein [Candidatus Synchoanobacter obligatus]|uniref:Uncharacterized protein n=1 Tax=Candidatus Synchoanobacter obligatus TaxID=2919597 RepID=A0ABT1L3A7_9GAMM|nr:hypothetical protein [Candidatus Synchoanobacter obligatus]MCP8351716.1 hypothetical protein [Candidatus Synchoanobacter obligatus]
MGTSEDAPLPEEVKESHLDKLNLEDLCKLLLSAHKQTEVLSKVVETADRAYDTSARLIKTAKPYELNKLEGQYSSMSSEDLTGAVLQAQGKMKQTISDVNNYLTVSEKEFDGMNDYFVYYDEILEPLLHDNHTAEVGKSIVATPDGDTLLNDNFEFDEEAISALTDNQKREIVMALELANNAASGMMKKSSNPIQNFFRALLETMRSIFSFKRDKEQKHLNRTSSIISPVHAENVNRENKYGAGHTMNPPKEMAAEKESSPKP